MLGWGDRFGGCAVVLWGVWGGWLALAFGGGGWSSDLGVEYCWMSHTAGQSERGLVARRLFGGVRYGVVCVKKWV